MCAQPFNVCQHKIVADLTAHPVLDLSVSPQVKSDLSKKLPQSDSSDLILLNSRAVLLWLIFTAFQAAYFIQNLFEPAPDYCGVITILHFLLCTFRVVTWGTAKTFYVDIVRTSKL